MAVQEKINRAPIDPAIFRAYDIRGVVDVAITEEAIYSIGLAYGSEVRTRGSDVVITARDGRLSSPRLAKQLIEGLLASGCDVIDIGEAPSPVLYFATHVLSSESGIMLTASHNSSEYNGVKMVINGHTLSGEEIQLLYQRIINQDFVRGQGRYYQDDIAEKYIDRIVRSIPVAKPKKIVIDCGNGIPGKIAPNLFRRLGCEVVELYCDVDGNFPNHDPDPSDVENLTDLIAAVKTEKADLGFAFDGDGDRLFVITPDGKVVFPDRLLMLFAQDVLRRQPQSTIIYDVKCTRYLHGVIEQCGGKPLMSKTGHSFVKATLKETGAALAGEMSGHIFFKERWYGFDDGLYTAARLLEILANREDDLSTLLKQFPEGVSTPEIKLLVTEETKFAYVGRLIAEGDFAGGEVNTLDGARVEFDDGWGLVRVSNTSPYLILRFEADNEEALERICELFRQQLRKVDAALAINF